MDRAEIDALLLLNITPGFGPVRTYRCIQALGSAGAALEAGPDALARALKIGVGLATKLRRAIDEHATPAALARQRELIQRHQVALLPISDPRYPRLLRLIPDPPPLLFVRGELIEDDALALGVVGARRCTHYGREQADRFSAACATAGLCIVSGGAYGIDAAAHRAALRVRGRTIAVIGSGLATPYPADHVPLFDQIAQSGAVISELPMDAPPRPENFPLRNRIISGLSLGVLVVEAAERSGALITARLCAEEHNREVMAVPGRVDSATSAGCHKVLREGWATLVTGVADVLDALGEAGQVLKAGLATDAAPGGGAAEAGLFDGNLSDSQRRIVAVLQQPLTLDQLTAQSGLPVHVIQADLTMLQLRGVLAREEGKLHLRRQPAR